MTLLSHRAFDVRIFLRGTQVFLPLPLPHGFQVIRVKGGNPPACWHLLYPDTPPVVQRGQIQCPLRLHISPDCRLFPYFLFSFISTLYTAGLILLYFFCLSLCTSVSDFLVFPECLETTPSAVTECEHMHVLIVC